MELVKIIKYLEKKFPLKLASKWDKVGLQVFNLKQTVDPNQDLKKILVCLDLTQKVVEEAISKNVELIITRHPFIFEDLIREKKNPAKKLMIQKLVGQKILVYSIHTNYDASPNQKLLPLLGQDLKVRKSLKIGVDHEGYLVKLKAKVKLKDLKNELTKVFPSPKNSTGLIWDDTQLVDQFYIASGSGGQTMIDEELENCFFVTGEMKWNSWIYANDNHVSVLALGHYMENYFVNHLKEMLVNAFPQISVFTFDVQNQYN